MVGYTPGPWNILNIIVIVLLGLGLGLGLVLVLGLIIIILDVMDGCRSTLRTYK
jgi:hypothetical protein